MSLPKIVKVAKETLIERTGLNSPRVVNIRLEKGQYHVIMDMFDGSAKVAERTSRTFDVEIDETGKMCGFSPLHK